MNSVLLIPKWLLAFATFLMLSLPACLLAEDTEVFDSDDVAKDSNMLIVLDNSGSMNEVIVGSSKTRMVALSEAFAAFTANPEVKDINLGLMSFSNGDEEPRPHGVSVPISPIDDQILPIMMSNLVPGYMAADDILGFFGLEDDNLPDPYGGQTVRNYLPQVINAWSTEANGGTPIVDSLHEAALYLKGMKPKWGHKSAEWIQAAHPSSYTGVLTTKLVKVLTGSKTSCAVAVSDCGTNCVSRQYPADCAEGVSSCHSGTGCSSSVKTKYYSCGLGSQSACESLDSRYSCSLTSTGSNCSMVCNGPKDLETGRCLVPETQNCGASTFYRCSYQATITSCLRGQFECDGFTIKKVDQGDATYNSPVTDQCQSNTIVLMSDGEPNVAGDTEKLAETHAEIQAMTGRSCAPIPGEVMPSSLTNTLADGRCGPELTKYLSTVDQSASVRGDNLIKTYTLGFAVDDRPKARAYLKSLAVNGNGRYFSADNSEALAEAFLSITQDVARPARSFAAPVYTVDPDSMLANSKDIYLPLFKNSKLPVWSGNLKKFKLDDNGEIVDANNAAAFDKLGQLKKTAVDFWMPGDAPKSVDSITSGGFANNIDAASRNLLTDVGGSLASLSGAFSKDDLGNAGMSNDRQTELINYIKGFETDGVTERKAIGDILHSKPTLISYEGSKQVLFFGTNEGLLHAVDAADASAGGGVEKFAFMPSRLAENIEKMARNRIMPKGGLSRIYGVDGSITAIIKDKNKNGKVDLADGDKATLVFGMRRGGSEYYALDVTNPDSPSLKWKIEAEGDFSNLGETWSKPKPTKLRYLKGGKPVLEDVLVFGGGYDNRMDEENRGARTSLAAGKGNGVYIVSLETGEKIWSYTNGDLQHSVPSDIRALDMDGDGGVERLYFGDTGGNIWRVDLNAYDNKPGRKLFDVANNAKVTHFANLAGSGSDSRKFFFEPDVSIFKNSGKERLVLSVGSGYRSHPLSEAVEDRFYVISDDNVRDVPPEGEATLTEADLMPVDRLNGESFLPENKGWYKPLNTGLGEKVLASAITFMNKVAFTTFAVKPVPTTSIDENGCVVTSPNQARAYVLDLMTGLATADLDGDGAVNASDEGLTIPGGDILGTPQLFFNKPSDCSSEGCDHIVDLRVGKKSVPLIQKGTVDGGNNLGGYLPKVYWVRE